MLFDFLLSQEPKLISETRAFFSLSISSNSYGPILIVTSFSKVL